jgi:hypothetical protein
MIDHDDAGEMSVLWRSYVQNQAEYEFLKKKLLSGSRSELLPLVRNALMLSSERLHALRLLKLMSEEDRKQLMPELLSFATWQNQFTDLAKELVFSVSREWLRENILRCAEPLLGGSEAPEFWGILEICSQIDTQMALELARQLTSHIDPDIRDAGESFIAKMRLK